MNNKEARTPKLSESKWEAIDVFLFANGQCTSPPRKYHLSSDQLSSWDTTLNYMARTLYGWQISRVEIFDIDGVKIGTPLEFKNGSAYIAVPPSEVFKPAGYDKYLMKAIKNVLFHRSGDNTKQEKRSCCSVDCRFSDQELNAQAGTGISEQNEIPKMIANLTDILNETQTIPKANGSKAEKTPKTNGKDNTLEKTQEDPVRTAKPNALTVKPQKQTRTLFQRSLTPQERRADESKNKPLNKPTPGKINTNPHCKPKVFKSPAKVTPQPTHKLRDTINSNFETVPDDYIKGKINVKPHLSYKFKKYSDNSEKPLSVLKLVSLGNSHEAIHTIKTETSDQNKHSSVPNLFYPEYKAPTNHKYTSTTTIVVQQNIEQGTTMTNKNSRISNDALISLNKEEFQIIVDRIVERILGEKANNSNQKVVAAAKEKPKLVYAKVVQSPTKDGTTYDRTGRVITIMNENEVVNFKVNIEVANISDTTKPSRENEKRKRNESIISESTSSSSSLEDSCCYCNNLCECQCLDVQPNFYRKPQIKQSWLRNRFGSSVSKSQSNQGDVRNESKDIPKVIYKDKPNTTAAAPVPNSNNKKNKSKLQKKDVSKTDLLDAKSTLKTPDTNQKAVELLDEFTQTEGLSEILLEAKEHSDGRYTFHLPPLNVLRYYNI